MKIKACVAPKDDVVGLVLYSGKTDLEYVYPGNYSMFYVSMFDQDSNLYFFATRLLLH